MRRIVVMLIVALLLGGCFFGPRTVQQQPPAPSPQVATLAVTVTPGELSGVVTGQAGSVSWAPSDTSYTYGVEVTLRAEAAAGWRFSHWSTGGVAALDEVTSEELKAVVAEMPFAYGSSGSIQRIILFSHRVLIDTTGMNGQEQEELRIRAYPLSSVRGDGLYIDTVPEGTLAAAIASFDEYFGAGQYTLEELTYHPRIVEAARAVEKQATSRSHGEDLMKEEIEAQEAEATFVSE